MIDVEHNTFSILTHMSMHLDKEVINTEIAIRDAFHYTNHRHRKHLMCTSVRDLFTLIAELVLK